jgi:NADPH2:quinone reductase
VGINAGETFFRKTRSADAGGRVLLGWEFAGEVIGVGAAVRRFKVGDRVFGTGDMRRDGAWAERVTVDDRVVAAIPDALSYTDAASLPIGAITVWEAIFRDADALPVNVNRVLVIGGAGGVGSRASAPEGEGASLRHRHRFASRISGLVRGHGGRLGC